MTTKKQLKKPASKAKKGSKPKLPSNVHRDPAELTHAEHMKRGYTAKEEAAIQHFLLYGNKTEAYRACYDTQKTGKTLNITAFYFFKKPKIASRVEHLQKLNEHEFAVTRAQLAMRYMDWVSCDPTEFIEVVKPELTEEMKEQGITRPPDPYMRLRTDFENLPDFVKQSIKSIRVGKDGEFRIEVVDKKGAQDSLAKLMGFMKDSSVELNAGEVHLHFDEQDKAV